MRSKNKPMVISQNIKDLILSGKDEVIDVVIVCDNYKKIKNELIEKAGFDITSEIAIEAGVVCGKMKIGDIENLKNIASLVSVELDEEQFGFD